MQVQGNGTLYKNQYGWSISDNQKQQDGTINKFYIPVKFKKDLQEPEDRAFVSIKGFTKPYKTKEGKLGISYFIMDYEPIGGVKTTKNDIVENNEEVNDPFKEFGDEIELENMELPF